MATQGDYTAGANALMHFIYISLSQVPPFERNFIPVAKIPMASGEAAKVVIDAVDVYRAQLTPTQPTPTAAKLRRRK